MVHIKKKFLTFAKKERINLKKKKIQEAGRGVLPWSGMRGDNRDRKS